MQQALEAVGRSGSEFVIQMDHKIRTVLNGLLGMVESLLNGDLVEDKLELATGASKSAHELLDIMNDVLDYCRLDAGHFELDIEEFTTADILKALEAESKEVALSKGLTLSSEIGQGVPAKLLGDPAHLRRALSPLIENALRYTSEGGIGIGVEVEGAGEHAQIAFYVQDTGMGIATEDVDRVCEAFECGDTSHQPGLGLGLTVVRRLVELMDGSFRLTSVVAQGSRATIRFPYNLFSAEGDAPGGHPSNGVSPRAKVLVVEDNAVNQKVALGFLRMIGCDTEVAWNGLQAIEQLSSADYDLVLMDCMMPELDGYEATRRIRDGAAGEVRAKTPIIALTADDSPGARQNCLRSGMDDYMTKPVRVDKLRTMLRIWLPAEVRPSV